MIYTYKNKNIYNIYMYRNIRKKTYLRMYTHIMYIYIYIHT